MRLQSAAAILLAASSGFAQPVVAQQSPIVVELFTSQGCAACPPADELLNQMVAHDGVLPLALHVDYWDYIGWADTFGKTAFSDRQKSYARNMGRKSVYTPQMIIAGVDDVQGNAAMQVMGVLAEHLMNPFGAGLVSVEISERGAGEVAITARSTEILDFATDVQLVHFLDEAKVEILSGENAGRNITYRNVVTDWQVIGQWDGAQAFSYTLPDPVPEGSGIAVVIQEQGLGPILGAARYP